MYTWLSSSDSPLILLFCAVFHSLDRSPHETEASVLFASLLCFYTNGQVVRALVVVVHTVMQLDVQLADAAQLGAPDQHGRVELANGTIDQVSGNTDNESGYLPIMKLRKTTLILVPLSSNWPQFVSKAVFCLRLAMCTGS